MQQDNNIAEQLRNLDNGLEPDLDQMDAHWKQMEAMLQPNAIPVKKVWPKWILNTMLGSVAVLMIAGFWYFSNDAAKSKNAVEASLVIEKAPASQPVTPENKTDFGLVPDSITAPVTTNGNINSNGNGKAADFSDDDANSFGVIQSSLDSLKINFQGCDNCPAKVKDNGLSSSARQALLQQILAAVRKPSQQFTIDNSKDTLLRGIEGTVLLVPAGSVGGKQSIEFNLTEFYNKSDFVLNQLVTRNDKNQLESGGMLHLTASDNGKLVEMDPAKPIRVFLRDTGANMRDMQLFNGVEAGKATMLNQQNWLQGNFDTTATGVITGINWIPQTQSFARRKIVTEVRVLNITDQPMKVKQRGDKKIGYFIIDQETMAIEKSELKEALKQKFGYSKIKFRNAIRNWFPASKTASFNYDYASRMGDSLWMTKESADRYKLSYNATRQYVATEIIDVAVANRNSQLYTQLGAKSTELMNGLQRNYSVDISKLGWINCDRFYNDGREKLQFAVNLGDSAKNFVTFLIFDEVKSMMNGYSMGNRVLFDNVPKGAKVHVISIGVDATGDIIYTQQPTVIDRQELANLKFESTSVPGLKTALSKMDR